MESLFSDKERSDPRYFPRFYFLLVPLGRQGLTSGDQWSGLLNSLKGELQKKEQKMEEKIGSANKKMEEKIGSIEEKIGSANKKMEEKMSGMDEKIGAMDEKIEQKIGSLEQRMEERMDRIDAMQAKFLSLLREMKK
jgi:peptidoglycan hydrolase CwlO-like protein